MLSDARLQVFIQSESDALNNESVLPPDNDWQVANHVSLLEKNRVKKLSENIPGMVKNADYVCSQCLLSFEQRSSFVSFHLM